MHITAVNIVDIQAMVEIVQISFLSAFSQEGMQS